MLKQLQNILAHNDADATWLDGLSLRQENGLLHVAFPHVHFGPWFARHKQKIFEEAVQTCFFPHIPTIVYRQADGETCGFRPSCEPAADFAPEAAPETAANAAKDFVARPDEHPGEHPGEHPEDPGGSDHDDGFESFVVNQKNAFPLATARNIAEQASSARAYNPFVLCGRSGTGKSHVLQAMARIMERRSGPGRVLSVSASRFCSRTLGWPVRPDAFWQKYDALLLDDLQEIAQDPAGQNKIIAYMEECPGMTSGPREEKASGQRAAQMVFACSGETADLAMLQERLLSRLESGMVMELMEPDLDVRMRYLQKGSKQHGLHLTRQQILFLAQRCPHIRPLQGLLLKIGAFCARHGQNLSQTDMENILRTGVPEKTPDCRDILNLAAKLMNLRPDDVLGNKRQPDMVLARQAAMYVCRSKLGLSYPELGRAFGGRDHSTIIHAVRKIERLLVGDKRIRQLVTDLEQKAQKS